MLPIALSVPCNFLMPILRVRFREAVAATTGMTMPETTMHENDFPTRGKDEVRRAGQLSFVQAEAVPKVMRK